MVTADTKLSLSEIATFVQDVQKLPRRPHINTCRRWILKGTRGRKLEAELIAGRWYTTPQAVREFLDAPAAPINGRRKKTAAQKHAEAEAVKLGI